MNKTILKSVIIGIVSLIVLSGFNTSLSKNIESKRVNDISQALSDLEYSPEEDRDSNNIIINRDEKDTLFSHRFSDKHSFDKIPLQKTEFVP